jgi:hypothetical protein
LVVGFVIAKDLILAKDNCRISAKILRDHALRAMLMR